MGFIQTASRYWINSKRLLFKYTRKPDGKELGITARIVALGILFIGFIGFIIEQILNVVLGLTG